MIPFFRKIRKKMADDNKPLKYMRYAIGEIVLVVIGILIALSINNWNEGRKEKTIEQNYLMRLFDELQNDKETLKYSKHLTEIRMNQINMLIDVIQNPDMSNVDSKQIIESIEKVTWMSYLSLSRIVYNELLNSGNMSLIKSIEIRKQLAIYNQDIDQWETILNNKVGQKEFTNATAGLLSIELLTAIENTESINITKLSNGLETEFTQKESKRIIQKLSSNNEAVKWLPQVYHYHVLAAKVIKHLNAQVDLLLALIEDQLDSKKLP